MTSKGINEASSGSNVVTFDLNVVTFEVTVVSLDSNVVSFDSNVTSSETNVALSDSNAVSFTMEVITKLVADVIVLSWRDGHRSNWADCARFDILVCIVGVGL